MNYTHEEIINSLQMIKKICNCHGRCQDCPFGDGTPGGCQVTNLRPINWKIKTSEEVWRAFQ